MSAIILFFQNYKKIILGVIAGLLGIVFLSMTVMIYHYKDKALKIESDYQKKKIKQKEEQLKLYEHMVAEQKAHIAREQVNAKVTASINENIKNINEGKCIKDENYYKIAGSIVQRFNTGLQ